MEAYPACDAEDCRVCRLINNRLSLSSGRWGYRFISSVLYHSSDGTIRKLAGAGLVHRPNLTLKALSSQHGAGQQDLGDDAPPDALAQIALTRIALALGLPEASDSATILTAVNRMKTPDPAQYVPVSALAGLLQEHHEAKALMGEREAEARITKAMSEDYITPAVRGWAMALCRENPDSFDAFLKSTAPA